MWSLAGKNYEVGGIARDSGQQECVEHSRYGGSTHVRRVGDGLLRSLAPPKGDSKVLEQLAYGYFNVCICWCKIVEGVYVCFAPQAKIFLVLVRQCAFSA